MSLTISVSEIVESSSNPLLMIHCGWKRVQLGQIADILNGFAFASNKFSKSEGLPLLRIRDISKNETDCFFNGIYDSTYIVEPGDLVVGMDGDFNCSRWKGPHALLNQRVCKIIIRTEYYDSKFLDLVLPGYLKAINEKTSSVTVKHLSSRTIAEIPIPLPPLPEQRRIVAKIEELFTRLDAGVEALRKVKAEIKRYRQAVLKHAFEGRLTEEWRKAHKGELESASVLLERIKEERKKKAKGKFKELPPVHASELLEMPEGWVWATIEQLANVGTGATPLKNKREYYDNGSIPWITSGALNKPFVSEADVLITDAAIKETNAKIFPKHTLLVAMYGEGKTRGKVSELLIDAATNQACAALVFEGYSTAFRPYIKKFFKKNYEDIRRLSSGGVQPNLNLEIIKTTKVQLPSISEQHKIVEEIERHFSIADGVEASVDQSLKQAERLRQSILKRAFEGKLVPQDSSDESAEKLLARIKAEKVKQEMNKRPLKKALSKRS